MAAQQQRLTEGEKENSRKHETKRKNTPQHMALTTHSSSPSHAPPVVASPAAAAAALVVLVRVVFGIASNGALTTSTDLFVHSLRLLPFSTSNRGLGRRNTRNSKLPSRQAGRLSWKQSKGW